MIPETTTICFADFCLYVYVIVDDFMKVITKGTYRPGPAPECSDSELVAMILIGESKGWDVETELLSNMEEHRDLFPHIPEQSRFNRRRRNLTDKINGVRQILLQEMDLAMDRQCIIDSLPIPVMHFHLVPNALPRSTGSDWLANGAAFGQAISKKQTYFGYKLHLLVTCSGVIIDFELTPANIGDLEAGIELLSGHRDLDVLGDKAYISAPAADDLWLLYGIHLLTVPRRNQKVQLPPPVVERHKSLRQRIETVNNQLNAQFNIETNHAHSFQGLCARLLAKITAHTLAIYINHKILGLPNWLQIKHLAFELA